LGTIPTVDFHRGAFLKDPKMGKKLYVGNLSYSVDDQALNQYFSEFGNVTSSKVMMDRDSGRSKGFGFVEMSSDAEAQAAIGGMNGKSVDGRDMVCNEARPMEPRTGGFGRRRWRVVAAAAVVATVVVAVAATAVAAATVTKVDQMKTGFWPVFVARPER
jgi:RNA recognition motif-containing protein